MPYIPKTWANGSAGGTPILAADLNHLEQGVAAALIATTVTPLGGGADDWANLQAAFTAGGRVYLNGQYLISKPLEWLNSSTWIQTDQGRDTTSIQTHSSWASTDHQMIRNWVDADWTGGETDHRVAPISHTTTISGSHNYYPRLVGNLFLNVGAATNVAGFSWATPNEGCIIDGFRVVGTGGSASVGLWGIDIQGAVNGLKVEDIVFYGGGFDRQISLDCSATSGKDAHFENITFSPVKMWHSRCYVNNVDNFTLDNWHMETAGGVDASAVAYIYLVSHNGFGSYTISNCSVTQNASTSKPLIRHDNDQVGNLTRVTPALLLRVKFDKTAGTWTGNIIEDPFNTISLTGALGTNTPNIEVIHYYDGQRIVWSNTDGTLGTYELKSSIQRPAEGEHDLTYGTTVSGIDLNLSDKFYLPVSNGTAFTMSAPTHPVKGYRLMFNIKNASGGAMGAITWNAVYKLAGAFTNPSNTTQRNIEFYYDGANWIETNRCVADI